MDAGFKQGMLDLFEQLQRNAVQLHYTPAAEPLAPCRSKIGGRPDVPADFEWPYFESENYKKVVANRPLSFMAQINLAESAEFDLDGLLPKQGLLSFFYELETERWGFEAADKGCARVFWFKDLAALQQANFPADLAENFRLPEFAVQFEAALDLPDLGDFVRSPLTQELPEEYPEAADALDWDDFEQLREEFGYTAEGEWSDNSKLLGWPDLIQNPMLQECEKVSRGIYCGSPQELDPELQAEIERASQDWLLLFQMGTVENGDFELMFGDAGHIYFWIKKQDLAAGNFDNIWLILQCY